MDDTSREYPYRNEITYSKLQPGPQYQNISQEFLDPCIYFRFRGCLKQNRMEAITYKNKKPYKKWSKIEGREVYEMYILGKCKELRLGDRQFSLCNT